MSSDASYEQNTLLCSKTPKTIVLKGITRRFRLVLAMEEIENIIFKRINHSH